MQDYFGGLKWFIELARKDKVLALITVLVVTIMGTVFVSYKVFTRSETKDDNQEVKDTKRQFVCDSISLVKDAKIAQLQLEKFELVKGFAQEFKEQRDKFQELSEEQTKLVSGIQTTNKRNTRKLKSLSKEIVEKNEN